MHNHPGSSLPSWSDLPTAQKRRYKYGLCVCHDGTVYKYHVKPNADIDIVDQKLAKLAGAMYNKENAEIASIIKEITQYGVDLEIL
jgi:uncharacterized protein YaaR (DUF327 family)